MMKNWELLAFVVIIESISNVQLSSSRRIEPELSRRAELSTRLSTMNLKLIIP